MSGVGPVDDLLGHKLPVLQRSLDEARHNHKDQHQYVDASEHFIHNSWLLHPKGEQA